MCMSYRWGTRTSFFPKAKPLHWKKMWSLPAHHAVPAESGINAKPVPSCFHQESWSLSGSANSDATPRHSHQSPTSYQDFSQEASQDPRSRSHTPCQVFNPEEPRVPQKPHSNCRYSRACTEVKKGKSQVSKRVWIIVGPTVFAWKAPHEHT